MSDMPPNLPIRPPRHHAVARGSTPTSVASIASASSASSTSSSKRAPPIPPKTSRVIDQYHADRSPGQWASSRSSLIPAPQRAILAQPPQAPRSRAQPRTQAFSTHHAQQRQESQLGLISRRPPGRVAAMLDSAQQRSNTATSSSSSQSFGSLARSVLSAAGSAVANTVVGTEKPRGPGKETIFLVPGWGVKRPTKDSNELGGCGLSTWGLTLQRSTFMSPHQASVCLSESQGMCPGRSEL